MTEDHQSGSEIGVLRPAAQLTIAIVIGWAVCFWPARMLNGHAGVWWMSIAAICCLIPGWAVVFLSTLDIFPNDLSALLIQTMVRMASIAAAAVIVRRLYPDVGVADFFGWLIGFYLLALTVEVRMLRQLSGRTATASGRSSQTSDSESQTD